MCTKNYTHMKGFISLFTCIEKQVLPYLYNMIFHKRNSIGIPPEIRCKRGEK